MSSPAISTAKIQRPGAVAQTGNLALMSQLLTPQFYKQYVEKFGAERFFEWLSTFGGMEEVKNDTFFWFENKGKNQLAVSVNSTVSAPAAGATVTVTIQADDLFDSGTKSPLRVGEVVRIASSNIEGKILTVPAPNQCTIRPLKSNQAFVSNGSADLLANEVLLLSGITDAGEASNSAEAQIHLDVKLENTITEIRDSYNVTDKAGMAEVFYTGGFSGSAPVGLAGQSLYTLKGLYKTDTRFQNNINLKLMRGSQVTNTGVGNSKGTKGMLEQISSEAPTVTYSSGNLDISKLHEITRQLDVTGSTKEFMWLMDVNQKIAFSDSIYKDLPAGAWVWGTGEKSQEASLAYGFESIFIDGYHFRTKKEASFNTEVMYGKSPADDFYRDYGVLCPMGEVKDAKTYNTLKNLTVMYQQPPAGGFIRNGIRVWRWGGGSQNPSTGEMVDRVEMIAYRGVRVAAAINFLQVRG